MEELVQGGIAVVENIVFKNKQDYAVHQQKNNDDNISRKAAEKLLPFLFADYPHGFKAKGLGMLKNKK